MSKLTDLIIEQIEQGQNALKREHNIRMEHDHLVNEIAVKYGLDANYDRDKILSIIMMMERSDNE
tara:strand:- start:194 stop:388 length:195 start_codon:yes stop_codon:yes gene_type:complete